MAISDTTNRIIYQGNESTTTPYVIPFRFDDPSWLRVIQSDSMGNLSTLTLGADYTITGQDIKTTATVPADQKIVVLRATPKTQPLVPGAYMIPSDHEQSLDQIVMSNQDRNHTDSHPGAFPLTFPLDEPDDTQSVLPSSQARAGKILSFDSAGQMLPVPLGILNDAQALTVATDAAADSAQLAADQVPLAAAEVVNAANQVTLAAAQVALATIEKNTATNQATIATDKATIATDKATIATDKAAEAAASLAAVNIANAAGHVGFLTLTDLNADLAHDADTLGEVVADDVDAQTNNGVYIKIGASGAGSWTKSNYDLSGRVSAADARIGENEKSVGLQGKSFKVGKNKIDPTLIREGFYYSPGGNTIKPNANYRCTGFIPVEEGVAYFLSGNSAGSANLGYFSAADDNAAVSAATNGGVVPSGQGIKFIVCNVTSTGSGDTSYDNTVQLEVGNIASSYEPYGLQISEDQIEGLGAKLDKTEIIDLVSHNLIDPSAINYIYRYSTSAVSIITDNIGLAASGYIPVVEGETYALAGAGVYTGFQGGYFTSDQTLNALSNITFISPPAGSGKVFEVPVGQGITHVVVSLQKLGGSVGATSLAGEAQLEHGEVATAYQAYNPVYKIKPALLPDTSAGGGDSATLDAAAWYNFVDGDEAVSMVDRLPNFREAWLLKNKDLVVCNVGTSLTARTTEHCTDHPDAATRPPLMHSNNFATIMWDRMAWDNQHYSRYDSGDFTESGTFATTHNLAEWDDGAYRNGLTRYSNSAAASVSFVVPLTAWQYNYIYRTDSVGCTASVTVAEGNGKMEVYNGSAWVEANGYSLDTSEAPIVARTIGIVSANTGNPYNITAGSKSNTTYQKRLKMRCKSGAIDSRSETKTVTITRTGGGARLSYWGTEWSPREWMITYINAARGSHRTDAGSSLGLPRFADNEVWGFKPDLMLFELGTHNDGAGTAGSYSDGYFARLVDNYVFHAGSELSMVTRSAAFGLSPEYAMFTASTAWNFGGINDDGTLKISEQAGGKMMTTLDKYSESVEWVRANHPTVPIINAAERWVRAGNAIHGDLKTATLGSGKGGYTLTNEGSHWNDTGSKIMAKAVLPLVNFTS